MMVKTLKLSAAELVNLEVAVRARVESMEDNGDPDTFGFKPLWRKLDRARETQEAMELVMEAAQ